MWFVIFQLVFLSYQSALHFVNLLNGPFGKYSLPWSLHLIKSDFINPSLIHQWRIVSLCYVYVNWYFPEFVQMFFIAFKWCPIVRLLYSNLHLLLFGLIWICDFAATNVHSSCMMLYSVYGVYLWSYERFGIWLTLWLFLWLLLFRSFEFVKCDFA